MDLGLDTSALALTGLGELNLLPGLIEPLVWLCGEPPEVPWVPFTLLLVLLGGGMGSFRPPVSLSVAVSVLEGS